MLTWSKVMSPIPGKPARAGPPLNSYAISRVGTIAAFAPNCRRVRYRKDECRQCLDACPENAIVLNPGPEISRACTECGLCATACPTEVFRDDGRREHNLWRQAAQLRASQAGEHQKRALTVACHKVTSQGEDSLPIHCLGNITPYLVAALAFIGYEELQCKMGACSACRLKEGEKLFLHSVQTARTLLGRAKPSFVIHLESAGREEVLLSRRSLFSPVATALGSLRRDPGATGSEDTADSLSGRKMFYHLLEHGSIPSLPEIKYSPDLPWGRVAIEERLCSGCGICAAVCPTGALTASAEEGSRLLHFISALCFNCRLCIDACSQKAARFEEEFTLARKGSPDEARVLARISLPRCNLCADPMRAGRSGLCPTCERRQLSPPGTPVQDVLPKADRANTLPEPENSRC